MMRHYLLLILLFVSTVLNAQTKRDTDTLIKAKPKLVKQSFVEQMHKRGKDVAIESIEKFKLDRIAQRQRELIAELKLTEQQAKITLKDGIDTLGINRLLNYTNSSIKIIKDGIFINRGSSQTQRNLAVSAAMVSELSKQVNHQKLLLGNYSDKLDDLQFNIDSLYSDSSLYTFSNDSAQIMSVLKKITVIVKEVGPIDTALNLTLISIRALQLKVDLRVNELRSIQEDIEILSSKLSNKALSKEFPYMWEPLTYERPLKQIFNFSKQKEALILNYYIKDNIPNLGILALLVLASWYFIRSLKEELAEEGRLDTGITGQVVVRYPFLSAILIVFSIFQFIFEQPPYVINFILWFVPGLCLAFIFYRYVTGYWMRFWLTLLTLFVIASVENMFLQTTRAERIFMMIMCSISIIFTASVLFGGRRNELKERGISYFIAFVFICEVIAFLLNLFGRFNMAKTFYVSGISGGVIAIVFLWVARLINEGLVLASSVYKQPNRKLFFLNFERVGTEAPPFFYVVLTLGWLFLVGRNFYGFKKIYDPITLFLTQERSVGDYKFTVVGLLLFFVILASSVFLSKLTSFFASEPLGTHKKTDGSKKLSLGNWILLIRITIICAGIFVAFMAVGIPLDKVTIVLGALSVGVGLGLQSLVTNLVSGLIISIERPLKVGDLVEIDGKTATMKSIGFRSSIMNSYDGSCIVIPNGELLNKQLVNWTMGDNMKRNSFMIGVSYDTDLEKAKDLIYKELDAEDRLLEFPAAEVVYTTFNDSSVDMEVVFWPKHMSQSRSIKSDLILKVHATFDKHNIIIPFPQQDVHVRSLPESKGREKDQSAPGS